MSTRRSEDLTADLLQDIAAEQQAPTAAPPEPATAAAPARRPPADATDAPAASAFVETSLFVAPRTWQRPSLARSREGLSISAGPVRVRFGRRRP